MVFNNKFVFRFYLNFKSNLSLKKLLQMTQTVDPLDNTIAEKINGILKGEYLENYEVKNF